MLLSAFLSFVSSTAAAAAPSNSAVRPNAATVAEVVPLHSKNSACTFSISERTSSSSRSVSFSIAVPGPLPLAGSPSTFPAPPSAAASVLAASPSEALCFEAVVLFTAMSIGTNASLASLMCLLKKLYRWTWIRLRWRWLGRKSRTLHSRKKERDGRTL